MTNGELVKCPCCKYPAHKSNIQPLIDKWHTDHLAAIREARERGVTDAIDWLADGDHIKPCWAAMCRRALLSEGGS